MQGHNGKNIKLQLSPTLATHSRFKNKDLAELPILRDALSLQAVAKGQCVTVQRLLKNGA